MSDCRSRDCEVEPQPGQITLVEIGHEIISTVILMDYVTFEKKMLNLNTFNHVKVVKYLRITEQNI